MTADQQDPQDRPDQDAEPASQPTGARAEEVEEGEDQDAGPASEPAGNTPDPAGE